MDEKRFIQAATARFWCQRRVELLIHLALYTAANVPLWLNLPAGAVFTAPDWLRATGLVNNIPWLTANWGILLLMHILLLAGATLGTRWLRRSGAAERLRLMNREPTEKAKRKPHPSRLEAEESWADYADDDLAERPAMSGRCP